MRIYPAAEGQIIRIVPSTRDLRHSHIIRGFALYYLERQVKYGGF